MSVLYILSNMSNEFQTWKEHFIDQAKGLIPHQKYFYTVSMQHGKGEKPLIKMISPTEQVVDRAKAKLNHPPSVYDPVTGIMQHTSSKHMKRTPSPSRKRKRKQSQSKKYKYTNKKKVTKSKKSKITKKKSRSSMFNKKNPKSHKKRNIRW